MKINGKDFAPHIYPSMILLDLLRDLGFKSVKRGCGTANCGLCTVIMDNRSVLSCSVPAARADGKEIYTLEGFQDKAAEIAEFLADEGADQCGFCAPGFVMNVIALEMENPSPTEREIDEYLVGNLCRCTGYMSQHRAMARYFAHKNKRGVNYEICK